LIIFYFLKKDQPKSSDVHTRESLIYSDRYFPTLSQKRLNIFKQKWGR